MITNIKIKWVSRCAMFLSPKSLVDRITDKDELGTLVTQFLLDLIL